MDVTTEVSTTPWAAIILGALSIGGTVISGVLHSLIKKSISDSEENAKLKHAATLAEVKQVKSDLELKLEKLNGDFRVLQADVKAGIINSDKVLQQQMVRFAESLRVIKTLVQNGEARFAELQKEMKEVHVFVDRIKRGGG